MLLPSFAPRAVARYQDYTEALCHELIDGFIESGRCDGAVDYAQQIPPRVIAHLIGIGDGMADQFVSWVNDLLGDGLFDPERRLRSRNELLGFIGDEVEKRRTDPRDDLLSELLFMELDDPDANITPAVVVGITNLLIVAGIDTTWSSIGSALWHLGTNPDDLQRLLDEPELLPDRDRGVPPLLRPGHDGTHRRDRRRVPGRPHQPRRQDPHELPGSMPRSRAVREPRRVRHRPGQEPPHRLRLGHPSLRRLQPGTTRDDHGRAGLARAHPRLPRERSRTDEVGGRAGTRSPHHADVVPTGQPALVLSPGYREARPADTRATRVTDTEKLRLTQFSHGAG